MANSDTIYLVKQGCVIPCIPSLLAGWALSGGSLGAGLRPTRFTVRLTFAALHPAAPHNKPGAVFPMAPGVVLSAARRPRPLGYPVRDTHRIRKTDMQDSFSNGYPLDIAL